MDFKTFPKDQCEALAMLWLKSQDLSELSPEDDFRKFKDAEKRIRQCNRDENKNNHQRVNY